jgi:hypothetical protein
LIKANDVGRACQRICPDPRLYVVFCNKHWVLWGGLLAPHPTPKLQDHPLSAVSDCLFNIFAVTLHIWRPSPLYATMPCRGDSGPT